MAFDSKVSRHAESEGQAESDAAEAAEVAAPIDQVEIDADGTATAAPRVLERVLERVAMPTAARPAADAPSLRIARVVALQGRTARIAWREGAPPLEARLADEVEGELIARVVAERGLVLVEQGAEPTVVGVLQTRERASERVGPEGASLRGRAVRIESEGALSIKAETIEVEGGSEVLLRAGPVALRLRQDGSVELVGGSIYLTSRGVFRLIGRVLRLN